LKNAIASPRSESGRGQKVEFEGRWYDPSEAVAEHRRHHRCGTPSNVNSDPELRAFILARLDTMTFKEIALAVAATFPPERRTSPSSIQRFWSRSKAKR